MFIRYHLIYFAIGCLLTVLAKYFHSLFYVFFILYILFCLYRLNYQYVIAIIVVSTLFFLKNETLTPLPTSIEGTVKKTTEKYCFVQTEIGMIQLYHEHDLKYGDQIKSTIEPLMIYHNSNDHAFDEHNYLYGQKVFYKARITQLEDVHSSFSFYQFLNQRLSSSSQVADYQRLFLFGEKSENILDDYQQLSELSLVHLFALSGMHIHILYHLLQKSLGMILEHHYSKWLSRIICSVIN